MSTLKSALRPCGTFGNGLTFSGKIASGEAKTIPAVRARTAIRISFFPKLNSYHHITSIVKWLLALFEEHSCSTARTAAQRARAIRRRLKEKLQKCLLFGIQKK
jgi:hypothetical protein